jgi:peptidoglycan-N-acetylglucosamine deacetylase
MRALAAGLAAVVVALAWSASAQAATAPVAWTGQCTNGYVALTFDDGPTPYTRQYVDALAAQGAHATFFNVGQNMQARPTDTQYQAAAGMRLENHTWDHPHLLGLTDALLDGEIAKTKQVQASLAPATWQELLRPPYGEYDGHVADIAGQLNGLSMVTWTIDPKDWNGPSATTIANYVLARAKDKSIVLSHDGYATTLAAIPQILAGLKARKLCPGQITASALSMPNEWGVQEFVTVIPWKGYA